MRHCVRMRFTFTRPYLGTARRRSKTLAVCRYSGGSRSSPWIWVRPAFRSRFSRARRVRMSFARLSASMRCVSERSGAWPAELVLAGVSWAAGMGGDHTHAPHADNAAAGEIGLILLDLYLSFRVVRVGRVFFGSFAGLFLKRSTNLG